MQGYHDYHMEEEVYEDLLEGEDEMMFDFGEGGDIRALPKAIVEQSE